MYSTQINVYDVKSEVNAYRLSNFTEIQELSTMINENLSKSRITVVQEEFHIPYNILNIIKIFEISLGMPL